MTLLFTEGFDNLGGTDGATYGKWYDAPTGPFGSGGGNAGTRTLTTGRYGSGKALQMFTSGGTLGGGNSYNDYSLPADSAIVFVGMGFMEQGSTSGLPLLWLLDNLFNVQLDLRMDAGNHIYVTRNGTTLCTGTTALQIGQWNFVELGAKIDPSVGWAELRINNIINASYYGSGSNRATANGNTRASSLSSMRYVRHGSSSGNSQNSQRQYDDIVVNDNNGTKNNDFLGDVRVIGLLPNAASAVPNTNLTKGGSAPAATNWQSVNENPIDGDVTYVSSAVPGTYDTYRFPSLPTGATQVLAVASYLAIRRDDATARSVTTRVRSGSTEADAPGPAAVTTPSYTTTPQIMENNPVTSVAWTVTEINAVEIGPKVSA